MHQRAKAITAAIGALGIYAAPWLLAGLAWIQGPSMSSEVVGGGRSPRPEPPIVLLELELPDGAEGSEGPAEGSEGPAEGPEGSEGPAEGAAPPEDKRPRKGLVVEVATSGSRASGDGRSPSPRASRSRRRRSPRCEAPHPHVREAVDGVVEIDRSFVDDVTKDLQSFMSLGYSRPHHEGEVKGWYISGFSCSSPVHKAGFRRRDVLLRVNGKKTRSWVGVYLLYQKLKKKTDFEVELLRGGEPKTLRFRVVAG